MEQFSFLLSPSVHQRTLSLEQFKQTGAIFTFLIILICFTSKIIFQNNAKKLSWSLTLVNSFLMTIFGIIYLHKRSSEIIAVLKSEENPLTLLQQTDDFSALVCLWFAIANVTDIIFGLIFYRKYLGLLTAYFHHTLYIGIMILGTTGNGGFFTCHPFSSLFLLGCIEEIPTFLLALGSVLPSCRTDAGFGLSFFLLRICYHGVILFGSITSKCDGIHQGLLLLTFAMHANWFLTWVSKYAMGGKKDKKEKKEKEADKIH